MTRQEIGFPEIIAEYGVRSPCVPFNRTKTADEPGIIGWLASEYAGMHLNWCIGSNTRAARDGGYLPVVIGDACDGGFALGVPGTSPAWP